MKIKALIVAHPKKLILIILLGFLTLNYWNYWFNVDLQGVDGNHNGIRDDVEEYVIAHYDDQNLRDALLQYAEYSQRLLSASPEAIDLKFILIKNIFKSRNCYSLVRKHHFDDIYELEDIDKVIFNTRLRKKVWWRQFSVMNGALMSAPLYYTVDEIEQDIRNSCDFKVRDLENLIKFFKKKYHLKEAK